MGKLEEKRFELLCAEYEKEQAELEQLLASEQAQLDQFHEDTDRASHFLALAQKYTDFTELTAPMIHEFVEKILVHAPDRSTGERVQEIEIYPVSYTHLDVYKRQALYFLRLLLALPKEQAQVLRHLSFQAKSFH